MSYAYSYQTNSVSKWDTIQSDVADAYRHLDDEDSEQPPLDESVDNKANSADELLNVMTELNKLGKGFTYNVRGVEVK